MSELSFFRSLQDAMDAQSSDIWSMVRDTRVDGYRLRLGEVTATELSLYRLRRFWSKLVYIDTNEPNESATGADWEWLIGHDDQWVQIRVQAKIVNRTGSFSELGHPRHARRQQMDTLIDPPAEDVACRWMPLYVFYSSEPPAPLATLQTDPRRGCSAQLARHVRDVYGPDHNGRATLLAHKHLANSVPWSQIFGGLVNRLAAGESLSSIVKSLATQKFPADAHNIDDFWDPQVSGGICSRETPGYIQAITDRRVDEFQESRVSSLRVNTSPEATGPERADFTNQAPRGADAGPVRDTTPPPLEGLPFIYDEFPSLPSRNIVVDRPASTLSLPNFVTLVDIDRMPPAQDGPL